MTLVNIIAATRSRFGVASPVVAIDNDAAAARPRRFVTSRKQTKAATVQSRRRPGLLAVASASAIILAATTWSASSSVDALPSHSPPSLAVGRLTLVASALLLPWSTAAADKGHVRRKLTGEHVEEPTVETAPTGADGSHPPPGEDTTTGTQGPRPTGADALRPTLRDENDDTIRPTGADLLRPPRRDDGTTTAPQAPTDTDGGSVVKQTTTVKPETFGDIPIPEANAPGDRLRGRK